MANEPILKIDDIDAAIKAAIIRIDPGWNLPIKVDGIKIRITGQALESWRERMIIDLRETLAIASGISYINQELSVRPETMDRAYNLQKQGVNITIPEY